MDIRQQGAGRGITAQQQDNSPLPGAELPEVSGLTLALQFIYSSKNSSLASAFAGEISRISARTTFSCTNGSSLTLF